MHSYYYLLVWVISYFIPFFLYCLFALFDNKNENKERKMPFFNKFSIILLSIFATMNSILFHLMVINNTL